MKTKNKILSLLEDLSNIDLEGYFYTLTLNYKNIINSFDNEQINVIKIKEIINNYSEKIENFNLSINNYGRYDEDRYKSYYYNVDFVFYSKGIIFNFSSPFLTNREINVLDFNKLIKICNEHKKSSKILYDTINL